MQTAATTAHGLRVDLSYRWDIDDGINEGWIVHAIDAKVEGQPVGYIKLSYVPEVNFATMFATPFDYAVKRSGAFLRIRHLLESDPDQRSWSREQLRTAIADSYLSWRGPSQEAELAAMSDEDLAGAWEQRKAFITDEYRREHREFTAFHCNKPIVDFIRVYGDEDPRYYRGSDQPSQPSDGRSWQRQGIGLLLYEAAAIWMAEHGMCLWPSGVQSREAELAWEKIAGQYELGAEAAPRGGPPKLRRYLDGRQISIGGASPELSALSEPLATTEIVADSPLTQSLPVSGQG